MRRTERRVLPVVLALPLAISACGRVDDGPTSPAAATSKSSESNTETNGKPATRDQATAAEHSQPAAPGKVEGPSEATPTPATLKELLSAVDLRTFPVMEGAVNINKTRVGSHFSIPNGDQGTVDRAVEFYRVKLAEADWKPAADPKLWKIYDSGAQLIFVKEGYMLYAGVGISRGDGDTRIMNTGISHLGNLDARRLPRVPGAVVTNESPERMIYLADATPDAIKEFMRRELKKQEWIEFAPPSLPGVPRHLTKNDLSLHFLNRAAAIDIDLSPQQAKTRVIPSVRVLNEQLPILANAETIEFGENPLLLMYHTATALNEVVNFHRKEFVALGWKPRASAEKIEDADATLTFDAPEHESLQVDVLRDQKGTFVQIKPWPRESDEK